MGYNFTTEDIDAGTPTFTADYAGHTYGRFGQYPLKIDGLTGNRMLYSSGDGIMDTWINYMQVSIFP
jgi:hypothetical protein